MSLSVLAPVAALPWLQGFFVPAAATESSSHDVIAELSEWVPPDEECAGAAYGGLSLTADVAAAAGDERILASYTQGVAVLDRDDRVIAHASGFDCEGSADELLALAAGDAGIGGPVVALAATSGGRTESVTWLSLYRVTGHGELQPVFVGEVERHEGRTTRTGVVTLIPGGLVYRDPMGLTSLWRYDAEQARYVVEPAAHPVA